MLVNMQDVDDIHEYLLLKGVDAVSIHGGKEQEERNEAIKLFKVRVFGSINASVSHTSIWVLKIPMEIE